MKESEYAIPWAPLLILCFVSVGILGGVVSIVPQWEDALGAIVFPWLSLSFVSGVPYCWIGNSTIIFFATLFVLSWGQCFVYSVVVLWSSRRKRMQTTIVLLCLLHITGTLACFVMYPHLLPRHF